MTPHPGLKKVGNKIAKLRKSAALTQAQLARRLGMKEIELIEVEKGGRDLKLDGLGLVANVFGKELRIRFV